MQLSGDLSAQIKLSFRLKGKSAGDSYSSQTNFTCKHIVQRFHGSIPVGLLVPEQIDVLVSFGCFSHKLSYVFE